MSERHTRQANERATLPDSVAVLAAHAREHEAIMSNFTRLNGEVGTARDDIDKLTRVVVYLVARSPQAARDALVRMVEGS